MADGTRRRVGDWIVVGTLIAALAVIVFFVVMFLRVVLFWA